MSLDIDDGVASATPVMRRRQGHLCCEGWDLCDICCEGCCDVRRAVIVLCILSIVGNSIGLIFNVIVMMPLEDEDYAKDSVYMSLKQVITLQCIALISASSSLVGASTFNKFLVMVNVIYLTASIFIFATPSAWLAIVNAFWLYPHIVLVNHIHKGVMSKEKYPYERQCCCSYPPVPV